MRRQRSTFETTNSEGYGMGMALDLEMAREMLEMVATRMRL